MMPENSFKLRLWAFTWHYNVEFYIYFEFILICMILKFLWSFLFVGYMDLMWEWGITPYIITSFIAYICSGLWQKSVNGGESSSSQHLEGGIAASIALSQSNVHDYDNAEILCQFTSVFYVM